MFYDVCDILICLVVLIFFLMHYLAGNLVSYISGIRSGDFFWPGFCMLFVP